MNDDIMTVIGQRFDKLELLAMIGAKSVLDLDEAVLFTGYSKGHLYKQTSGQRIPHFKKGRKLYFKKSELEEWMLDNRVKTLKEIDSEADTRITLKRFK